MTVRALVWMSRSNCNAIRAGSITGSLCSRRSFHIIRYRGMIEDSKLDFRKGCQPHELGLLGTTTAFLIHYSPLNKDRNQGDDLERTQFGIRVLLISREPQLHQYARTFEMRFCRCTYLVSGAFSRCSLGLVCCFRLRSVTHLPLLNSVFCRFCFLCLTERVQQIVKSDVALLRIKNLSL